MTSAEFAAKYRVLKSLTEHGARSQIAQELALGRMVMVHHLDIGSPHDRQRLLASVAALEPSGAAKVIEIADVDGTKVIVTQFLATFTDFPTWVRQHATVSTDAATVVMEAVPPPSSRAPAPPASEKSAQGFTALFGAGGAAPPAEPSATPPTRSAPAQRSAPPPPPQFGATPAAPQSGGKP